MARALDLARLGLGSVSPNPMVGCVIVHNNKIIGEGFHRKYGEAHAEVHAINSVKDKSLLSESTVYVNLEPCAHYGKTPPCARLLAGYRVKKVVIANTDPNPLVAGKGIEILEDAGVEVETSILEEDARNLNKRFFTAFEKKRPWIILKWAETADSFIARSNYDSKWITNDFSRKLVHKWRAEEDAVLVGKNTALHDNPTLNVRDWSGCNPLRVVVDHNLKLHENLIIFDRTIPTVCYNLYKSAESENLAFVQLPPEKFYAGLLSDLHKRNVRSLIIEGGASTLSQFIEAGLWDEARVFRAPNTFGGGISAPRLIDAEFDGQEDIMGDILTYYKRKQHG